MINYCKLCKSRTLSHGIVLKCSVCMQFVHIKCTPLTRDEYKCVKDRNCPWQCKPYNENAIPFYHIDDDEEFAESLYNFYSDLPIDLSILNYVIFNPFLTNENLNSPLMDNDPDINFHNDIQRLYADNEDHLNTSLSKLANQPNFGLFHINIRNLAAHKNELAALSKCSTTNFQLLEWLRRGLLI